MDVVLQDDAGNPVDVCSPLDRQNHHAFRTFASGLSDKAAENRRVLIKSMLEGGLTNYPSEYWHWTYGDQGWAYRSGHANAIYGRVTPSGYTPPPEDAIDAPLEFVAESEADGSKR